MKGNHHIMPSREFAAIPLEDYPPYAARFQMSCVHWQQLRHIVLPTRAYLAREFGLTNANTFTLVFEGRMLPTPQMVLSTARACEESVEEHLTVLNVDLAKRNRPPVDTFGSLIRYVEHHMGNNAVLRHYREVLQATQEPAWLAHASRWRDLAEKALVANLPPEQKIEFIVQLIEGGHAPSGTKRLMAHG